MSAWIFLKVFGDLCIYFSVIGAFPGLFLHEFTFFRPALLCAAGAGMAALLTGCEKKHLRFLGLILPLSSLVLTGSLIEFLMLLLPLAYTVIVIVRGRLALEYYSFRQTFLRSFIPWVCSLSSSSCFNMWKRSTIPGKPCWTAVPRFSSVCSTPLPAFCSCASFASDWMTGRSRK